MPRRTLPLKQRILAHAKKRDSGCLEFTGYVGPSGRPYMYVKGKDSLVYRLYYELVVGPLDGAPVDHLCFNKRCINPEHLELTTQSEHSKKHNALWRKQNPLFACGHPRSDEFKTTEIKKNGHRYEMRRCRTCHLEYHRNYQRAYRRAEQAEPEGLCKHGFPPLFCKFARPGKPCK